MKIYILIPVYNEEKTVGKVINEIRKQGYKNIVILNDGSIDNTINICMKKKVILLNHIINLGQGAALQTGFDYCKKKGADIVITFDADGQFDPRQINDIVKPIINQDINVILGSRFLGKAINMSLTKKVVLKLGIIFTGLYSGIWLTDTHNGFRAFNKNALAKINITQNRMAHASEIIDQIKKSNLTYKEIPVTVYYNKQKSQGFFSGLKIIYDLLIKLIS